MLACFHSTSVSISPNWLLCLFFSKVNSLCVWQYNRYAEYGANFASAELDRGIPTPLTDSADEPRLVCSAVHTGGVQQLKVCRFLTQSSHASHALRADLN